MAGVRLAELNGIPPTGRTGKAVGGVSTACFAGGRLLEAWTTWHVHGLLAQLGIVPSAAAA